MVGRWESGLSAEVQTARASAPSSGLGGAASAGPSRAASCWGCPGLGRCTRSTKSWMLLCVPCIRQAP